MVMVDSIESKPTTDSTMITADLESIELDIAMAVVE
jgi:hypothetical protein